VRATAEGPEVVSGAGVDMPDEGEQRAGALDAAGRVDEVQAREHPAVPHQHEGRVLSPGKGTGAVGAREVPGDVEMARVGPDLVSDRQRASTRRLKDRRGPVFFAVGSQLQRQRSSVVPNGRAGLPDPVPAVDYPTVDVGDPVTEIGEDPGNDIEVVDAAVAGKVVQLLQLHAEDETLAVQQRHRTVVGQLEAADDHGGRA
jgi:hypothetical protein